MEWPAGGTRDAGSSPGGRRKAQHDVRAFRLPPGDDGSVCPKAVNLHLIGIMNLLFSDTLRLRALELRGSSNQSLQLTTARARQSLRRIMFKNTKVPGPALNVHQGSRS